MSQHTESLSHRSGLGRDPASQRPSCCGRGHLSAERRKHDDFRSIKLRTRLTFWSSFKHTSLRVNSLVHKGNASGPQRKQVARGTCCSMLPLRECETQRRAREESRCVCVRCERGGVLYYPPSIVCREGSWPAKAFFRRSGAGDDVVHRELRARREEDGGPPWERQDEDRSPITSSVPLQSRSH